MSEWKEYKLGDIIQFGNGKERPRTEGDIPVFGGNGILGFCDQSNYNDETIIIGRVGAYCGSVFYQNQRIWVSDNALAAKQKGKFQSKFLYYFLKNLKLNNFAEGSSHPLVTQTLLNSIEVSITDDINEQIQIANILSSLDDKIDLLNRQNKTLEKIAETLFRQWFVEEADESWEETTLYDVIEMVGGGTPKTVIAEYWEGDINWLAGGDIASNHKNFVFSSEKRISEKGLENSSANLLPKFATAISARGTVGKYCILSEPMTFSQSNYGIKPKYKDCFFFTYLLIGYSVAELQSAAYGSVFDTITTNTFKEHKINIPSEKEILDFEITVASYFKKMLSNTNQIRTLTQLRDALLPKLMSGEVRIL